MLREEEKSRDDLATGVRDAHLVRIVEHRSLTSLAALRLLLSNSTIFYVRLCGFKPRSRPI